MSHLPTMYQQREYEEAGGLLSYWASSRDGWRRGATYADKILKGAKPADLPVEQPTKFELIINLKMVREYSLLPRSGHWRSTHLPPWRHRRGHPLSR